MDLPSHIWLPVYFNSMFSIARTYKEKDKNCSLAMFNYFNSLSDILPNKFFQKHLKLFLSLNPNVIQILLNLNVLNSFFSTFPVIKNILINNPNEFLKNCYDNNELMFMFVYLMYIYMIFVQNSLGYNISYPVYFDIQKNYNINNLTKTDWGRPTWFVIHISALYSPQNSNLLNRYTQFLTSLQFILPCDKCKEHLKENLKYVSLQHCGNDNKSIFKCSWELHNIVNRSLNKYQPSFEEALNLYSIDNLKKSSLYSFPIRSTS